MGNFVDLCRFAPLNTGTGQGNPTFTNASSDISLTGHGLVANQPVFFTTSGTLPINFTAFTLYYVIATGLTANTFRVSASVGGAAITAGSAGSGTHTSNAGIQVGSAITAFDTPVNSGVVDGLPYAYAIFDAGNASETGICYFNSTGTMMARYPSKASPSGSSPINYTSNAQIAVTAIASSFGTPGMLFGMTTANNGGAPNTKIDVTAGKCRDDADIVTMVLQSLTTIDCGTTGANGLDTGALGISTTYHAFVISKPDGTTATLASTSLTPALPSGYLFKRRIASFRTDAGSHILAYTQIGDTFLWSNPVQDLNASAISVTTATLNALTVPVGIVVEAIFSGFYTNTAASTIGVITSPSTADVAASAANFTVQGLASSATNASITQMRVVTNTSAQIRLRFQAANGSITLITRGWVDRRGRDA